MDGGAGAGDTSPMANAHGLWKKELAEQGQQTFEEIGISFEGVVENNSDWLSHVMRQRFTGRDLQNAFNEGMLAHGTAEPQEAFESFVERVLRIKKAGKAKRKGRKARKK